MTEPLTTFEIGADRAQWARGVNVPAEPPAWCRGCLAPLAAHTDGVCDEDVHWPRSWKGTYSPLALGVDRPDLVTDVPDSTGTRAYLFWVADCFDPPVYFVRGENFSDAYEWFLAYLIDRGSLTDCTEELREDSTTEEWAAFERGESEPAGYSMVDGYNGLYYTETVGGRWVGGEYDNG